MAGSDSTRATQACRADPRVSAFAACLRRVDRGASRMMDIQRQRVLELCNEFRLGGVNAQYTALAEKSGQEAQLIHRLPRGTPDREALVTPRAGPRDVRTHRVLPSDQDARSVRLRLRYRLAAQTDHEAP